MRQESTKEPAFGLEVGCFLCRGSLYEKGVGIRYASKLAPGFQAPFSVCFANPQGAALRAAALVRSAFGVAVFAAAKTSGRVRRCGGVKRLPLEGKLLPERRLMRCSTPQRALPSSRLRRGAPPARFVAAKRRSPEGGIAQQCGRPITQRVIVPVKRVRKKAEVRGANLFAHSNLLPFFDKPAAAFTATQRLVFGWVLGRGFCPQKPPP